MPKFNWNIADNQPSYTSREPEEGYKSVLWRPIMRGEEKYVDRDDPCDPMSQEMLIKYQEPENIRGKRELRSILSRAFNHGCHCAHDCCGHRHGGGDVEILNKKYALVKLYSSRNY